MIAYPATLRIYAKEKRFKRADIKLERTDCQNERATPQWIFVPNVEQDLSPRRAKKEKKPTLRWHAQNVTTRSDNPRKN